MASIAGYSGTPLWKKLGLKAGQRVCVLNAPRPYGTLVPDAPQPLLLLPEANASVDLVHLFVDQRSVLAGQLVALRQALAPQAVLWVSWPKKASKRPTDITEDLIRELALPLGWVDIKVCAVDATWSGLKLMVRLAQRPPRAPR